MGPGFHGRVTDVVRLVPPGSVVTYGDVGRLLGSAHIARQVGWALAACAPDVPWHRVVNARGELTSPSASEQRVRLAAEGVEFDDQGRVLLRRHRWQP
ncbi:MAG: MGMT family protein [Myxococcales bacterium]|nr:MGMT family protein [Myxococcales bacterium]